MVKLTIVHFQPLEKYPPIINLLYFLSRKKIPATVISTNPTENIDTYINKFHQIVIFPYVNGASRYRIFQYLYFYFGSIIQLIKSHPSHILWMETLSSFPVIIYYFLRIKKPKLYVHYHEYESPDEIKNGMFLSRLFHRMEKKIYPQVTWLSHTNHDRLNMFVNDNPEVNLQSLNTMPNYPPKWWGDFASNNKKPGLPIKLVYVGALSTETTYLKEIVQLVENSEGKLTCDFYSFSLDEKTQTCFKQTKTSFIHFKGSLKQTDFPEVISMYDVGLILYKGHIPNYIYNAPNKLFEYLACGLDVWYPQVMAGIKPYTRLEVTPKVVPIDFENISSFNWKEAISHEHTISQPTNYFCEEVYEKLISKINE